MELTITRRAASSKSTLVSARDSSSGNRFSWAPPAWTQSRSESSWSSTPSITMATPTTSLPRIVTTSPTMSATSSLEEGFRRGSIGSRGSVRNPYSDFLLMNFSTKIKYFSACGTGSLCSCLLPEALKASAVHQEPGFENLDGEKRRLRSAFSCLSSISMRQRQVSVASLFFPPWELRRSSDEVAMKER